MATVVKTAAFGALIRFINQTILLEVGIWQQMIIIVAVLTLIVGNITAVYQTNLKRLLAYSGIANAGYILVAVATLQANTVDYVLYYLASYSIATILAFTIYSIIKDHTGIDSIEGLKGLITNNKLLTVTLAFALLSLAGIPPLAGFFGKYAIFANAVGAGNIWLVIISILASLVGVYYYLRVMATSFQPSEAIPSINIPVGYKFLLTFGILLLLALGIMPDIFSYMISK